VDVSKEDEVAKGPAEEDAMELPSSVLASAAIAERKNRLLAEGAALSDELRVDAVVAVLSGRWGVAVMVPCSRWNLPSPEERPEERWLVVAEACVSSRADFAPKSTRASFSGTALLRAETGWSSEGMPCESLAVSDAWEVAWGTAPSLTSLAAPQLLAPPSSHTDPSRSPPLPPQCLSLPSSVVPSPTSPSKASWRGLLRERCSVARAELLPLLRKTAATLSGRRPDASRRREVWQMAEAEEMRGYP